MTMPDRRVEFAAHTSWRNYLPELRWDWWDDDEGCLSLSFGNRRCDPLLSVELIVRRIPHWLDRWMR